MFKKNKRIFRAAYSALILLAPIHSVAEETPEAAKLLKRVTEHYMRAGTIHVEATVTDAFHGELEQQKQTSYLSAWVGLGGRFRYEGRNFNGSGAIVSNGTEEWHLARSWNQYTRQPAGTYFGGRVTYEGDNWALLDARSLVADIMRPMPQTSEWKRLAPQMLHYRGRNVRCTVIGYRSELPVPTQYTLWIDPVTLTILKREKRSVSSTSIKGRIAPYGPRFEKINTATYTVTEIDARPIAETFVFTPPEHSIEVASLPSSSDNNGSPSMGDRFSEHVGKPLPAVTLEGLSGAKVALSSYAGHPLLISVWATWCAPCLQGLPALDRMRRSLSPTDLRMISIDQDEAAETASMLLEHRGYTWQNFHAGLATARQLGVEALPTILLADAAGKVVYFGTGEDMKALTVAIRSLGPAYRVASSE